MKHFKSILYISLISIITIFSGCTGLIKGTEPVSIEQNKLDNDTMNIFNEKKFNDYNISIKEKDTLKNIIKTYNKTNPNKHIIIDKTKEDIIFDYEYECKTLAEFMDYIKVTKNIRLVLNKYNSTMYELKEQEKITDIFEESFLIDVSQLNFVDQPIQWDGVMSHEEILTFIEDNFNIPILYKKQLNEKDDTSIDMKNLKLNKKVSDYSGTLKKIIQKIAIENKLFIKYQQGIIVLSENDTRSFSLKIPYLDLATEEMFENITSLQLTPYEDLESQLQTVMSDETKININKSNGTIIIRGNYDDLREAQLVIKNFHEIYSRSIALDVYIYEVDLSKSNKLGVSFESSDLKLDLGKLTTATTTGLSTAAFNDKLFINFLNQFGNTRILTKPKLETINGIPVSMKITTKQDYVANIEEASSTTSNTNTSSTANTTNVEKETVETGFRLGIYPMAQKDGKIKLIIKPLISQLMKIEPYEYGTTESPKTIQLITTTEKDFSQIININDGEVAIISGYIYEKDNKTKDTLPGIDSSEDTFLDFLMGTKGSNRSKTEMVIAVKATVIK